MIDSLIKTLIKNLLKVLPAYKSAIKNIKNEASKRNVLEELLWHSIKTVPYYRTHNPYKRSKESLNIREFPFLKKSEVVGNETLFISDKFNKMLLRKISTGGTSGISLNLYKSINSTAREHAFIDYAFSHIDIPKNLRIGVLRGNKPTKGLYSYNGSQLILSSYDLSRENILLYLDIIHRFKINCLHVYPSSIRIFCKYIKELNQSINLPKLKGILSSSEILSNEDKDIILDIFPNVVLVDLYGQNEHVALALSINKGPYKFIESYGYVEFRETGLKNGENKICEIVATGLINKAMPLIRYCTEDYVEIDKIGNVVSIIGRTQDFIVNLKNEIVPCILQTRTLTLENVVGFQFYQEKIGELEFRVVVNEKFSNKDERAILEDIGTTFNNYVIGKVKIVDTLIKTKIGKQKRLIQNIDINQYF